MADMSNESPTSSIEEPTSAASPKSSVSSDQVNISTPSMDIPASEEGKVEDLLDALAVLKEHLQTEFNVSLNADDSKLCVCLQELEEKIKICAADNHQASSVVDDVLAQHDIQNKQTKEKLNGLEDELSKKQEELKKTKDEHERSKSKWKDKESNYKKQLVTQSELLNEKGDDILKLSNELETRDNKIKNLEEQVRTIEAELEQGKVDTRKGHDTQKLINEIEARDSKIQCLLEKNVKVAAELEQAKEDAQKRVEEAERALKAKESCIQTLENQLSILEIEKDRNLWKGKCEGLQQRNENVNVNQCIATMRDAIHLATCMQKTPKPANRQHPCDTSIPTSEAVSRCSTPDHLSE